MTYCCCCSCSSSSSHLLLFLLSLLLSPPFLLSPLSPSYPYHPSLSLSIRGSEEKILGWCHHLVWLRQKCSHLWRHFKMKILPEKRWTSWLSQSQECLSRKQNTSNVNRRIMCSYYAISLFHGKKITINILWHIFH